MKCSEIIQMLEELAPLSCACEWDNPGLLAGRSEKEVKKILVALDVTDEAIERAEEEKADMIVSHHPLIFRPVKQVNDRNFITRRIIRLIRQDISCYAMHTNFDSAPGCMADLAAQRLGLQEREPLEVMGEKKDRKNPDQAVPYGIGTIGRIPNELTVKEMAELVKKSFDLPFVTVFGLEEKRTVRRIAICPGSGGSVIEEALAKGADVLVTGDISHHEGIDAAARNMAVIDGGHYGLEHIFIPFMSRYINEKLGSQGVTAVEMPVCFPADVLVSSEERRF